MTTNKVYASYAVKIYNNKPPKKFQTGKGGGAAPVLDPPFTTKDVKGIYKKLVWLLGQNAICQISNQTVAFGLTAPCNSFVL